MTRHIILAAALCLLTLGASALFAQDTPATAVEIAKAEGLKNWTKVHEVFSHPRCASCHVADGRPMWMGNGDMKPIKHPMFVGGDPDNQTGQPGAMCTSCHGPKSSQIAGGPPGAEVWLLAPKEMVWFGQTSAQICAQIKDPERNGNRSLAEIETHIREDDLVHSGWNPSVGRDPVPYSIAQTAGFFAAWMEAGAPCPVDAP